METNQAEVIEFKRIKADIPAEIAHPASKNYPIDDILGEMLAEANIPDEEEELELESESQVYIHKLNYSGPIISPESNMDQILGVLEAKLEHLKHISKRSKYMTEELVSRLDF